MKFSIALVLFMLTGVAAPQLASAQIPETSVGDLPQDIGTSWYSNPKMVGGFKSNTTFGRPGEYTETNIVTKKGTPSKGPKRLMSRSELYLGARASSGWGVFGYYNYSIRQYNQSANDGMGPEDPSIAIIHPIFDDNVTKLSGQYRQFFPASERSGPRQTFGESYSNTLFIKLRYGYDFGNVLNLRYYSQPNYKPEDSLFGIALMSSLSKHITPWCRLGIGEHTSIDMHEGNGTATLVQIAPSASFFITRTMFIGPRVSFPVYVNGATYEGPKLVSTTQMQGEISFEAQL